MSTTWHYVGVGVLGNAHAEGVSDYGPDSALAPSWSSVSSYDDLDTFTERHGVAIADGAPVVDLRPLAGVDGLVSLAFRAPLCDPRKSGDGVDRWDGAEHARDPLALAQVLAGAYFGRAGVAAVTSTSSGDEVGAFDSVSPERLARYWSEHGARVGVWDALARRVVWADGGAS